MHRLLILRSAMTRWNLFVAAGVFAAGLLMKAGAPAAAVMTGVIAAAVANLILRHREKTVARSSAVAEVESRSRT